MSTRIYNGKECTYRNWEPSEDQYLIDNYASQGAAAGASFLGRSKTSVSRRASTLGISKYDNAKYKYVDADGYMVLRNDRKKSAKREHRVIMERILGRKLTANEVVHHIDGNKLNNDPANLQVMTRAEHINHRRESLQLAQGLRDSLG